MTEPLRRHLLPLAVGIALALATLEGVSRWYFNYRSVQDPVLGSIVPSGFTVRSRIEGSGVAHYQANGVRRSVGSGEQSEGQILCLGDSFTEAHQVRDDEVYTAVAERALTQAGLRVEVLNVGRSGWSAADYVAQAHAYRELFKPAWTVIQIHDSDLTSDAWQASKTHFRRRCGGCPIEVVSLPPVRDDNIRQVMRRLRNRFAVVGLAHASWLRLMAPHGRISVSEETTELRAQTDTAHVDSLVSDELQMLADAYDKRLTILLLTSFDPNSPGSYTAGESAVRMAAGRNGMSLACSKDEFPKLAEQGVSPHGFSNTSPNTGHLNAAGHAATARALTRELLRLHRAGLL
jgi:lysophospholipase L1-like esterase